MKKHMMLALLALSATHVTVFAVNANDHFDSDTENTLTPTIGKKHACTCGHPHAHDEDVVETKKQKFDLESVDSNSTQDETPAPDRIAEAQEILKTKIATLRAERTAFKEELCIACISSTLRDAVNTKKALANKIGSFFTSNLDTIQTQIGEQEKLIEKLNIQEAKKLQRMNLEVQLDVLQTLGHEAFNQAYAILLTDTENQKRFLLLSTDNLQAAHNEQASLRLDLASVNAWINEVEEMRKAKKELKTQIAASSNNAEIMKFQATRNTLDAQQRARLMARACVKCKTSALSIAHEEKESLEVALAENTQWIKELIAELPEDTHNEITALEQKIATLQAERAAALNQE